MGFDEAWVCHLWCFDEACGCVTVEVGCGPVVMVESQRRLGKRKSFAEKRVL